ncbi:hypothetical protein [Mycolicibacterium mageritense]|uniref:Uncharacterized protein n=1 Tax=Mycolicibacterium mageritense TaxID=53462 RepID=A0AAI8U2A0_MYCME|nr:hypothetical protein [Mycolicibacterium mageritense]BDY33184.1 hypothetical protein hbim_07159 [Mycolicibacterium mageritense]
MPDNVIPFDRPAGPPREREQVQLSVLINEFTAAELSEYIAAESTHVTEAVRRLIGVGAVVCHELRAGGTLLVRRDGRTCRITFDFGDDSA